MQQRWRQWDENWCGGGAGGGWRQLGDTAAAVQAAGIAHWRCHWHLETAEKKEGGG